MAENVYQKNLDELVRHTLLHLYIEIDNTAGFVPAQRRNEILVKFLKPRLKQTRYKSIKGEIKLFILTARKQQGDLEMKLQALNRISVEESKQRPHPQQLLELLETLENDHQFESAVFHEEDKAEPGVIYFLKDQLADCFDERGNQITPFRY